MEENFGWVWKFILQALGCSMFLLPYAASQVGLPVFSFILLVEAYVTGNSMIIFRSMAEKRNERLNSKQGDRKVKRNRSNKKQRINYDATTHLEGDESEKNKPGSSKNADTEQYMIRTNYFTIVSDILDVEDSFFWYTIIRIIFLFEVVICSSFYFKIFADIVLDAEWIPDLTPAERPGYRLLIHVMIALFLIAMEEATEHMDRQSTSVNAVTRNTNIENSYVGALTISDQDRKSSEIRTGKRNTINMPAVVERLHGYSWKRCCLFFLLLFFVVATAQLNAALPIDISQSSGNLSAMCPGLIKSTDHSWFSQWSFPGWKDIGVCTSVVMFSFMHFAIFLPICLEELKLDEIKYARNVKASSLVFMTIFLFMASFGIYILGNSAPVIFPSAFGSNIYGFNINVIAALFTVAAMLLRIMACCRLIQVLFHSKSDSAYWIIVSLLFVVSYYISLWTPSVLYLAILAGGGTSNLLLIIFPGLAYLKYFKEKNRTYFLTLLCVIFHAIIFLVWILYGGYSIWSGEEPTIDMHVGENCKDIFDEIWSKRQFRCSDIRMCRGSDQSYAA